VSNYSKACGFVVHCLGKSSSFYTQLKSGLVNLLFKAQDAQSSKPQNRTVLHSLFLNFSPVDFRLDTLSTSPTTKTTLKLTKYRSIV